MQEHVRAITWENAGKLAGFYQRGLGTIDVSNLYKTLHNKKAVLTWLVIAH